MSIATLTAILAYVVVNIGVLVVSIVILSILNLAIRANPCTGTLTRDVGCVILASQVCGGWVEKEEERP